MNPLPQYSPIKKPCGSSSSSGQNTGSYIVDGVGDRASGAVIAIIVVVVIVILLGAVFVGVLIGLRSERIRQMFPFNKLPKWVNSGNYSTKLPMEGEEDEEEAEANN